MNLRRILKHWFTLPGSVSHRFPDSTLAAITQAIAEGERNHLGEVRFVVESALPWREAWMGISARERALALFSELRIWDTECNNGVLIYLLLADRDVEILADRGIDRHVGAAGWETICQEMESAFRQHHFESGVLQGIVRIHALLAQHFPAQDHGNPNELPDAPVTL